MSFRDDRAGALREWARGDLALEAAGELLANALSGRLLDGPWIRRSGTGGCWFDPDIAAAEAGVLSGGERRVLAIATSLASSEHPVNLGDAITGLDPHVLDAVLRALGHAGGHRAGGVGEHRSMRTARASRAAARGASQSPGLTPTKEG